MEAFDQVVPHEFLFANKVRGNIGRLFKAARTERCLNQRLEKVRKEKELAANFLGEKLMPLSDEDLKTLIRKYPDLGRFVNILIESRKEMASKDGEAYK